MIERGHRISEEDGFTLIELLIVIAVLGILAAVTVFGLNGIGGESLSAACRSDAKSVVVAEEAYRASSGGYYSGDIYATTGNPLVPTYLRTAPGNATKYKISADGTGKVFVTKTGGTALNFEDPATDACANL